jgi:hypothetical protein
LKTQDSRDKLQGVSPAQSIRLLNLEPARPSLPRLHVLAQSQTGFMFASIKHMGKRFVDKFYTSEKQGMKIPIN